MKDSDTSYVLSTHMLSLGSLSPVSIITVHMSKLVYLKWLDDQAADEVKNSPAELASYLK